MMTGRNSLLSVQAKGRATPTALGETARLPGAIVYMPRGEHFIQATTFDGEYTERTVIVDEQGAIALIRSLIDRIEAGNPAWIDREHDDGEAVAWVHTMEWDPGLGVVANVTWTPLGEDLLRGRRLISFSPTFLHNPSTGKVAGLLPVGAIGGLVNQPAFEAMPAVMGCARLLVSESLRQSLNRHGYSPEMAEAFCQCYLEGGRADAVKRMVESLI